MNRFKTNVIKLGKDGNDKHQEIQRYFPFEGVIFREEEDQITIHSPKFPQVDLKASMDTVPSFNNGDELKFTVKMYAFRRNNKSGRDIPVNGTTQLVTWFTNKATKKGFSVIEWVRIQHLDPVLITKDGVTFPKNAVEFQGVLKVNNKNLFNTTVEKGLGQGKAYGFGLLSIKE